MVMTMGSRSGGFIWVRVGFVYPPTNPNFRGLQGLVILVKWFCFIGISRICKGQVRSIWVRVNFSGILAGEPAGMETGIWAQFHAGRVTGWVFDAD
jgi:hypothetical protein